VLPSSLTLLRARDRPAAPRSGNRARRRSVNNTAEPAPNG
jgi:hypothetical protein